MYSSLRDGLVHILVSAVPRLGVNLRFRVTTLSRGQGRLQRVYCSSHGTESLASEDSRVKLPVILHFPLHSCVPGRAAGGSAGIVSAGCEACPPAAAPSPPSGPSPAAPAHAAACAPPLCRSVARCTAAAPAPGGQCEI